MRLNSLFTRLYPNFTSAVDQSKRNQNVSLSFNFNDSPCIYIFPEGRKPNTISSSVTYYPVYWEYNSADLDCERVRMNKGMCFCPVAFYHSFSMVVLITTAVIYFWPQVGFWGRCLTPLDTSKETPLSPLSDRPHSIGSSIDKIHDYMIGRSAVFYHSFVIYHDVKLIKRDNEEDHQLLPRKDGGVIQTQQLWQSLTTGSQTVSVPVTTLPPATLNPPPVTPSQDESLSRATVEKIVTEILEKQQQHQQQQQQQKKMTRNCLACGQPKSRYLGDGSSVNFFYQTNTVKYFYCSTKVFKTYADEGLTNPRMTFEDFAASPFFERELDAARQRGAEWRKVAEERAKRKSSVQLPTGRLCRFCHLPLKQSPHSPHTHTSFPGVAGKYIYCPSRVFSLYKAKGMETEMTWMEFTQSDFYQAERDRWVAEKRK